MERPGKLGRREAPHVGWETLCCDVRDLILRKLSMRDLACAATICRAFRGTYVSRVAEERASLIAVGEKAFGKGVFSTFTTALRGIILGLSPLPDLVCKGENSKAWKELLFTNAEEPAWMEDTTEMLSSDQPCGVFLQPDATNSFFLAAFLHHGCGGICCYDGTIYLQMFRDADNKLGLEVWVDSQAAALALGLLVDSCLERPLGLPLSRPRPLVIEFFVRLAHWEASLDELEDLWAPLRSLVEAVTIFWE